MLEHRRVIRPELGAVIHFCPVSELLSDWSLVEPGLRQRWGGKALSVVDLGKGGYFPVQTWLVVEIEGLAISLVNPAKAAKLTLRSIPVAVVIAILRGELAAGDRINRLDLSYHL